MPFPAVFVKILKSWRTFVLQELGHSVCPVVARMCNGVAGIESNVLGCWMVVRMIARSPYARLHVTCMLLLVSMLLHPSKLRYYLILYRKQSLKRFDIDYWIESL